MSKHPKPQQPDQPEPEMENNEAILALTDALQRERADAVNLRRQHEEQIASLRTVVKANVVRDLLPVIDNFERALKHAPSVKNTNDTAALQVELKKFGEYVAGVQALVKQFEKTLAEIGVSRIPTVGMPFDPKYHEAVSMEEGDGSQEIVSEELQAGYTIGDDVIRHAMVRVRMEK